MVTVETVCGDIMCVEIILIDGGKYRSMRQKEKVIFVLVNCLPDSPTQYA